MKKNEILYTLKKKQLFKKMGDQLHNRNSWKYQKKIKEMIREVQLGKEIDLKILEKMEKENE